MITDGKKRNEEVFKPMADKYFGWYGKKYNTGTTSVTRKINLTYSTVRTIVTSLYSADPEFAINIGADLDSLEKTSDVARASGVDFSGDTYLLSNCLELGLKAYLRDLKLKKENRLVIRDCSLTGLGVSKIGYKIKTKGKKTLSLTKDKGFMLNDSESGNILINEYPYALRIDPRTMLFPSDATSYDRLAWQIQMLDVSAKWIKKNYGVDVTGTRQKGSIFKTGVDKDQVTLYEIHSMAEEVPMVYICCEGYDGIIQQTVHPLYNFETGRCKNQFKYLIFNEDPDNLEPMSDIGLVESQIEESNVQINRRMQFAKKNSPKYMASGPIDQKQLEKLYQGEDCVVITSPDGNAKVEQIQLLTMGNEFYENITALAGEILQILGLTDYSMGGATQKRKATEANYVEAGRATRVNERLDIIEDFLYDQIDTLIEIIKEYQVEPEVFSFSYDDKNIQLQLGAQLLELTDMQIQVVGGSTVSLDKQAESKKISQLIELGTVFAPIANMEEIYKEGLRAIGLKNWQRFIKTTGPMPTPPGSAAAQGPQPGEVDAGQFQNGGLPQ